MVVIVSSENDRSTDFVIKYLLQNNQKFVRLGLRQFITSLSIRIGSGLDFCLKVGSGVVCSSEIKSYWLRKNDLEILNDLSLLFSEKELFLEGTNIEQYVKGEELDTVKEFLVYELEKKNFIGKRSVGDANKLISFSIARDCGFDVPLTLVSSEMDEIQIFLGKNKKVITKPIQDSFAFMGDDKWISSNNVLVDNTLIRDKSSVIFPSCLQKYVKKKVELRVFYLARKCYSMAIFSQFDKKTQIDFRNYNDDRPNRMVPYNLPKEIESKIVCFMNKLGLKSGSLDIILTPDNKYVFLEVNPFGQYGMVAFWCNYPLDRKIAKYLTKT